MGQRPPQSCIRSNTDSAGKGADTYKHFDMENVRVTEQQVVTWTRGTRVREQERDVYCSFICSHAVAHTSKLLRSLEKPWHEPRRDWHVEMSAVWRACRHMWACVSVCVCMTAFGVYRECVLFLPMCLHAQCLLYTELEKWHVRTLMSGNWDNLRLTNKPCQEEDPNNMPQLLYYSVFALGVMLLKSSMP